MASAPATSPMLSESQAKTLRSAATLTAVVLLALAGVKVATSLAVFLSTTLLALLGLAEGGLLALSALILIKIAVDLRYAGEVPQLSGTHFLNALSSWQDFCKTLIGLGVVMFLAAALRFSM